MIKVKNIEVFNFEGAIRGMRNPLNSWDKSDSKIGMIDGYKIDYEIGENDLSLMKRLFNAGTEHRKYLRQIMVSMDITAPLYWWKEFDTYKVGTTANSCSTMHKIASKEFTINDFSHEHLDKGGEYVLNFVIDHMNGCRKDYLESKDKDDWWQLIQLLPSSYNQKRTVTMNYENVFNIIHQRENHKLDEWHALCDALKDLPYVKELLDN